MEVMQALECSWCAWAVASPAARVRLDSTPSTGVCMPSPVWRRLCCNPCMGAAHQGSFEACKHCMGWVHFETAESKAAF